MYDLFSIGLKYVFVFIIYLFMFTIIRMIYLDIRNVDYGDTQSGTYLKLLNRIDSLPYNLSDSYPVENALTLGRQKDNTIEIKDPYISKKHFRITKDEDQFFLEDLGSSNGTYLNGERVEDVTRIKKGDIIKVGEIEFIFIDRE
ncbi:MAG: FHA domain-containing protein [Bacillota bacterium]